MDFTPLDWFVVLFYLLLTTWVGHRLSGKQATIKDFFLGGKTLPWWAVTGSIIATEISALTFIGVPGSIYALKGDWTYLQWGIGSILARIAVAYWLVPLYFEKNIFSPYDFIGERLGESIRRLVTFLFSLGAILGQSVRVLVTAIILHTVIPSLSVWASIGIIGAIALCWTWMGGMRTVIWTDVMQFALFVSGGLIALGVLLWRLGGWEEVTALNHIVVDNTPLDKLRWLDLTSPFERPEVEYTLWIALFAMPFQNFTAFGLDQLNTQRLFCCKNKQDARKAMCASSLSIAITLLMLAVGSALFAWYQTHPPLPAHAHRFLQNSNTVFPTWIVSELPAGLSGLILAGAFAAAISSLDSILAALSQTSLSILFGRKRLEEASHSQTMLLASRIAVIAWSVILTLASLLLYALYLRNEDSDLIRLAFGMVAYTYGPLLGILLAALFPQYIARKGLIIGTLLSISVVAWMRPELPSLLQICHAKHLAQWIITHRPPLASEWFYLFNALLTFLCALFLKKKER